jgi:RNA-splicing ligase RtcB
MSLISEHIPAGVGKGRDLGYSDGHRDVFGLVGMPFSELSEKQQKKAITQFGTLGSGNHFIELSLDEHGKVWTVLHSGSRGIGNQLASYHIHKAKGLMKEYLGSLEDPDLAHFTEGTPEFDAYIKDMLWAQRYAYESRARMNRELLRSLARVVKPSSPDSERAMTVQVINCHHNYTEREHHLGRDMWITRKGAIKAVAGDLGVIPGSMGTDDHGT